MGFDLKELDGQWQSVLANFGINVTTKPGQPCVLCGGRDRFHYTNKHGNGTWLCRQCTPEGSTGFGLLAKFKHWDNKETYKQLRERYGSKEAKKIMYEKKEEPVVVKFIRTPSEITWDGTTLANKDKSYHFAHTWVWKDHTGKTFGYVARLEFPDKETGEQKKIVWQIHHGYFESNPLNVGWHQVSVNPKPLFGYSTIGLLGYQTIIFCEGEKTCMALKTLIGAFSTDYLILCCQGGAAQINTTDFKPLVSYVTKNALPVYIWPDNDDTGFKHAEDLTKIFPEALTFSKESLEELGLGVGEDAADLNTLTKQQLESLIENSCYEIEELVQKAEEVIPETKMQTLLKLVNPLGVYEGKYAFYPKNLKCIQFITANNLVQEPTMLSVVGEEELHEYFPKIDKDTGEPTGVYDYRKAGRFLIEECHKRGTYDPDTLRGIGVWKDDGRIIVNTGVGLTVAGKNFSYDDFQSSHTYTQPGIEKIKLGVIASKDEIKLIKDIIYGFNWAKPYHAHLMLGALVQAPVASALRWRSHVWLIGAQGSGKSTLQADLIKPLLGKLAKSFAGASTAAGIRQWLKCDPFAVCFDEAEVRSESDAKRMKDIISLARISSSDEDVVIKGSAIGDAVKHHCQSPFILSSIKPFLKEESDIARFALLELSQPSNDIEARMTFEGLKNDCMKITEAFSERWIAFCIDNFTQIAENMIPVSAAMINLGLSPRTIDQYGQLIACAMIVNPSIDIKDFKEVLEEAKEHTAETEACNELSRLMNHDIRVDSDHGERNITISRAVEIVNALDDTNNLRFEAHEVNKKLLKYGLKVCAGYLYIASVSPEIEKILGYPGWNKLFKIINGVITSENSTTFGSNLYKSRYVKVPLELVKYYNEEQEDIEAIIIQNTLMDTLTNKKPDLDPGF